MNNKNLWIAILAGFILLTAGIIWAVSSFSMKIGVVDLSRISSNENKLYQSLNDAVQKKGIELQRQYNSAKTEAEKNLITKEFDQLKTDKQKEFTTKVQGIVKKVGQRKGLKVVASTQTVIYGDVDITEDVLKECNK
jgi:outer membrane protein